MRSVRRSRTARLLRRASDPLDKYLNIVMSIEGQISLLEARQLVDLARNTNSRKAIVEIGSYRGRSTVALAFGSILGSQNRVFAVDPHLDSRGILGGIFGPQDQVELYRNVTEANVGHIVSVVNLPSVSAARGWEHGEIGLLWIDADHRYTSVRADFAAWFHFVEAKGVIAFHDNQAPGVKQLLSEILGEGKVLSLGSTEALSWFQKKS